MRIFQKENQTNSISFELKTKDKQCVYKVKCPSQIWSHISLTSKTQLKIYVNGAQVEKFSKDKCVKEKAPSNASLNGNLVLGAGGSSFDDVLTWNKVLDDNEVFRLYSFYSGKGVKTADP